MTKNWVCAELSPLILLGKDKPFWIVSQRKLTEEETRELLNIKLEYDFSDTLGICGSGNLICSTVTVYGGTKEDAQAECDRLNNGGKLFEWFSSEEVLDE